MVFHQHTLTSPSTSRNSIINTFINHYKSRPRWIIPRGLCFIFLQRFPYNVFITISSLYQIPEFPCGIYSLCHCRCIPLLHILSIISLSLYILPGILPEFLSSLFLSSNEIMSATCITPYPPCHRHDPTMAYTV